MPELVWSNHKLRVLLLRRLRLPLDLDDSRCRCGRRLDVLGDHRAACGVCGVLKTRAVPLERMWARVCREAGGRVRTHVRLKDMNLLEPVEDDRNVEVVVKGLQLYHGAEVAVDATLVSPLKSSGAARHRAHWQNGAALLDAKKKKETSDYPELLRSDRCRLLVAGMEVGGRWADEAYEFVELLARAKAETAPWALRGSARVSYLRRWVSLLSFAAQDSFAETLVQGTAGKAELWNDWKEPPLGVVLGDTREAPEVSRLGTR